MEKEHKRQVELVSEILERERSGLFRYASYRLRRIEDVEDVMQNLSLSVLSDVGRYADATNVKAYIFKKLQNDCVSYVRKQSKEPAISIETLGALEVADLEPANYDEEFELINRLLSVLPAEQEEAIRLRLHGELSFQEIADVTGVPLTTAKSRFKYGIERLREGLKQFGLI